MKKARRKMKRAEEKGEENDGGRDVQRKEK